MSEEKELKLACLHQAGGDLDHAKALFDWVSGSVRATPDSAAAEVSAPKQDKPQQPFNYRHPSKYGTDVPRRCYLEELTPEERAIRDLVDTVERLGAHPLLTATVIQLMKAGEDLADWVDIGLRDKAIAALSPGNDLVLLDENPAAGDTEVRNQAEDEAAETRPCTCHPLDRPETCQHKYALNDCLKSAYVAITATPFITDAERPSDESQATDQDRVELKQTESSSQASSTEVGDEYLFHTREALKRFRADFPHMVEFRGGLPPFGSEDAAAGTVLHRRGSMSTGGYIGNIAGWRHDPIKPSLNIIAYALDSAMGKPEPDVLAEAETKKFWKLSDHWSRR